MQATFYTFAKNPDSTSRPSGSGTSKTVRLKDSTSMLRPTFLMDRTAWDHSWNYAYIPEFGRYYFIGDTIYNGPNAEIQMDVDVLASWKTQIGASTQYVVRSASASNGDIIDNLYPIKGNITNVIESDGAFQTVENGCFVLGIVSKEADYGSVAYYAMTTAHMTELATLLMNYVTDSGLFMDSWISKAFQNIIVDPLSKIVSANWFPVPWADIPLPAGESATNTVMVGDWAITLSGSYAKKLSSGVMSAGGLISKTFDLSQHPQAAARGGYMNLEPFTRCELRFQPFGVIPIDTTLLYGATSVTVDLRWDWATGDGWLDARANKTGGNIFQLFNLQGHVGVPIHLSQQNYDVVQAVGAAVGLASAAKSKDVLGVAAGVGDLMDAMKPQMTSSGQTGNFVAYQTSAIPRLIQRFYLAADDDNTRRGRPLMEVRQISGLSGYMQCDHVDLDLPATQSETETIKAKMEAGFYYE